MIPSVNAIAGSFVVIALAGMAARAQSTSGHAMSEAQVHDVAKQMLAAYRNWGPGLNTEGVTLTVTGAPRGGGALAYRLHADGLPRNHVYNLLQWPVTQLSLSVALPGVTFDESGLAICAGQPGTCGDPAKPNDPSDVVVLPAKGEPFRFGVVAEDDEKLRAFVKIVPVPN